MGETGPGPEYTIFAPEKVAGELERRKGKVQIVIDNKTGEIAKLGDPRDVREWLEAENIRRGKRLETKISEGGLIIPALTEAHTHPGFYSVLEVTEPLEISDLDTVEKVVKGLRESAQKREPNEPVAASDWNSAKIPEITRKDLDEVAKDRPVIVFDASFHKAVGNTEAMEALSELEKDYKEGELSGKRDLEKGFVTAGRVSLMAEVLARAHPVERIAEKMESNLDNLLKGGTTAVHELDPLTYSGFLAYLMAKKRWEERKGYQFPIREVFVNPILLSRIVKESDNLIESGLLKREELPLLGVKLFADGSFGARTALVEEPYADTKTKGQVFSRIEELNRAMRMARELGIEKLAIHAIGDKGIRRAIEMARRWIEFTERRNLDPSRVRIEHFELPLPLSETLRKVKDLGLWASPQPNFLLDYVYEDRLKERIRWICPHQEILRYNIPMMFGTDGMPHSMMFAVWCATHASEERQRLNFEEALLSAALTAAHYERAKRGKIMEGMKADILVCDPKLLETMARAEPSVKDVRWETAKEMISNLEGNIQRVLVGGKEVSRR